MSEIEESLIPTLKEQYSFSKLSTWEQCKYAYFLKYVQHKAGIGNAFSSYGSFVHSILEKYSKGELSLWDLPQYFKKNFEENVTEKFPWNKYKNLRESYYEEGLDFLKKFKGYDNYTILGVEKEFEYPISDWTLIGFIDLVFRDENGNLIIRDYKSKGSFKDEKEKKKYARQMYLYSLHVKETYGEYPKELQFLMFRKQDLIKIQFDEQDLQEAINWSNQIVADIRTAFDYPPMKKKCDDFYSQNLCNHREYCMFNPESKKKAK